MYYVGFRRLTRFEAKYKPREGSNGSSSKGVLGGERRTPQRSGKPRFHNGQPIVRA